MKIFRILVGLAAGVFVGTLFIYALEALGQLLVPLPHGFDPLSSEPFGDLSDKSIFLILLPVLFSYMVGSLVGGFFSGLLSKGNNLIAPIITGLVLMVFGFLNLMNVEHPLWFWIFSLSIYLPFAYMGALVARKAKGL